LRLVKKRGLKSIKKESLFFCILFCIGAQLMAQKENNSENLIFNGDFEDGNYGFTSDFDYNFKSNTNGQYSVTDNAVELNRDFRNPVTGDHTYGNGYYLVASSNGESGKKIWKSRVDVIPNSNYKFSVYFCNLYNKLPVKSSFAFEDGDVQGNDPAVQFSVNGKSVGLPERDIYRLYRWVYTSVTWYSGANNGTVTLAIENLNSNNEGNIIAIDDVEFIFMETMPEGYVPPPMRTIMSAEYRAEMAKNYKPSRRVISFADIQKGDEFAPGIYGVKYRNQNVLKDTTLPAKEKKFQLHNLIFNQSDADILPASTMELDRLAEWLNAESGVRIRIEGHTDNIGAPELNVKLSEERVYNVKIYLMKKGVAEDRIETIGYGGALPIADNSKEATRKLNRRVEFELLY